MRLSLRSMLSSVIVFAFATATALLSQATASPQKFAARVPFVGCKSDGQVGPRNAPIGKPKLMPLAAETAQRLAYYESQDGMGVLAPRGWYCFGTYGSNGQSLFVSPQPINATTLFSTDWKGFTGPVIQISGSSGETSGRFEVASIIARVFPAHNPFVHKVIAEGIAPASDFPSGPYPKDKLIYKSKEIVEYTTPAQTDGLGTQSRLLKNSDPINGAEILVGDAPDLISLAVRLSPDMSDLTSTIIQQVERDAPKPNP